MGSHQEPLFKGRVVKLVIFGIIYVFVMFCAGLSHPRVIVFELKLICCFFLGDIRCFQVQAVRTETPQRTQIIETNTETIPSLSGM